MSTDELWETLKRVKAAFAESRRRVLRADAEMIEAMTCPTCGRKPTVVAGGGGATIVLCRHLFDPLKMSCETHIVSERASVFTATYIEVFEDGPKRW